MNKLVLILLFVFTQVSYSQWVPCNTGLTNGERTNALTVSGTFIFAGSTNGVYRSADDGDNWAPINTGLPATKIIYCLATKGTNVFAGTHAEGIYKSDINGPSWASANTGLPYQYVFYFHINGSTIYAGTNAAGVFSSGNDGSSWTWLSEPLVTGNQPITQADVKAVILIGGNLLAGTYGDGIFISQDNGASWTKVTNGMSADQIFGFAQIGLNLFAATKSGVFLSINYGQSWTDVTNGINSDVTSLAVVGGKLFAGTSNGVFISFDNGANWTLVFNNVGLGINNDYRVLSLAVNGNYLFAGKENDGVYRASLNNIFTSVKTEGVEQPLLIYPNPVNDNLFVNYSSEISTNSSIRITNELGISVYEMDNINNTENNSTNINTSNLSPGVYFLTLTSGNKTETKKFVIIR